MLLVGSSGGGPSSLQAGGGQAVTRRSATLYMVAVQEQGQGATELPTSRGRGSPTPNDVWPRGLHHNMPGAADELETSRAAVEMILVCISCRCQTRKAVTRATSCHSLLHTEREGVKGLAGLVEVPRGEGICSEVRQVLQPVSNAQQLPVRAVPAWTSLRQDLCSVNVGAAAVMAAHYCWAGAHRAPAGIALISGCQEASMRSRESPKHKLHMYALSQARLPEAQRQPQQPTARMLLACRQCSAHEAARSHTAQQHRVTPATVTSSEHPSHGAACPPVTYLPTCATPGSIVPSTGAVRLPAGSRELAMLLLALPPRAHTPVG